MARFRATIKGQRGEASRLGTASSGITAKINGWDVGVLVVGGVNEKTGEDEFAIFLTSGSHAKWPQVFLGTVTLERGFPTFDCDYDPSHIHYTKG